MLARFFLITAIVPCVVSAPLAAQNHLRRVSRPVATVDIDAATGLITRGSPVQPRSAGTVSEFPNMDLSGFAGVDTGGGFVELFNDGIKGISGNASDLMEDFTFAYCSAAKDTSLGGPGGTVKLGFYEGYTRGGGPTGAPNGTAVAVLTLSGLPANSTSSSFFSGFACYFATVHFGDLVPFADGPIGYSWKFVDLGTDGVLAATFPYFANAGSCTGTTPNPDSLGQEAYNCCSFAPGDVYVNGLLRVVYTFAPYCIPFSIGIDIREAADLTATASPFTGDGIDADALSASPAIVGGNWTAQVTLGDAHGSSGPVALVVRTATVNGPNFSSPFGGRLTEPLIAGPRLAAILTTHDGTRTPPVTAALPLQFGILGQPWAAQATVGGGGFVDLSSAVTGVTGTR